ncbi:MAG: T9SS type A sorting domain-containing protein [Chitinophagales bacterium]
MKKLILLAACFSSFFVFGQQAGKYPSPIIEYPLKATINIASIKEDWAPQLQNMEMPAPGSESYRRYLIDLKEDLYENKKFPNNLKLGDINSLPQPSILAGWEGNPMGTGVPNDNDMAISNDGKIISVINSSIYIYDITDTLLYSVSLAAFSDTLGIAYSKFDPKVMYDPRQDKFIIIFLAGFEPDETNIIIGFSKTNDPAAEWNLYALPGNPKDNDRWTDFPMFAITEEELFLTINLIIPDEPWQTGFSETLIWQMNLEDGYLGDPLNAIYYDSIYFGGKPIRNLNPVKGGETTYGPDMYFLSDRNFSAENDTIFIVHVTGLMDEPLTEVEVDYSISDLKYGVPPQARQFGSHIFDTNDGRILGSYYEDGQIQFVGNTLDPNTGFCGIYHGIITDLEGAKNIHAHIIGDDTLDLGYPNISYSGHWDGDNQSIITFDHSAPEVNAGMSAVFFNYDTYSDILNIKTGDSYVNVLSGTYERWGDYTGSQRKYNEPGIVWVSGNFGKFIDGFPFVQRNNATWIASLITNDDHPEGILPNQNNFNTRVFPNPSSDIFIIEFELPSSGIVEFRIYDMSGRLVKFLLKAEGKTGLNSFSFSTNPLSSGNYLLEVKLNGEVFRTSQISKQ